MNSFLKAIVTIILGFIPSLLHAANYTESHYVTHDGAGNKSGISRANAWSIANFHDSKNWSSIKAADRKIGPGDVVYFSGIFNSRVIVTLGGSTAGPITLDGYDSGNCEPLKEVCTGSALLNQGMEIGGGVTGPDYLTIQDFRMTRTNSSGPGFRIYPKIAGNTDERNVDHTMVRRNYVFKTNGPLFYWYGGRYNVIDGNKFTHFGQNGNSPSQGVNLIKLENTLISNNEMGHDKRNFPDGTTSANMVEMHACHNVLIEYNNIYGAPSGVGLVPKEEWGGNSNLVVRFNKIHGNSGAGFYLRTFPHEENLNIYTYGNFIYNNTFNIYAGDVVNNWYVWSNILSAATRIGIGVWNNNINGLHIYNNTIVYNNTSGNTDLSRGGIALMATSSEYHIKNNILWNNHPGGEANRKQLYSGVPINSLERNLYYHSKGDPTIHYDGGYRTLAKMATVYGFETSNPPITIVDKIFVNPLGADGVYGTVDDNYSLANSSPLIGKGKPLSGSFSVNLSGGDSWFEAQTGYGALRFALDDALCPIGTDWTTNPPTVVIAKQGLYGSEWELGAYVYKSASNTQISLTPPKNVQINSTLSN